MQMRITAMPEKKQLEWQNLEVGLFCHFGLNTFNNREWGNGTDSPQSFNPTLLDAGQWAKAAKEAGFKYIILTAKHHDGFCLWPTETTDYSVKSSPWKDGKGDVVAEVAEACKQEGLLLGLYLSPWDRHEPCYTDKEAYDEFYLGQLTELLTGYGPLVEVWFDGAGSEGREYDWKRIIEAVHLLQPNAQIFNMGEPTIRWVGNEAGVAPYPCWNTATQTKSSLYAEEIEDCQIKWLPAECDVPNRRFHWFWHPEDEDSILPLEDLMDIYYRSVGHGCNLLLNVAPDNRGLLPDADVESLLNFGKEISRRFSCPIAVTTGKGYELELELGSLQAVNHVILMEDLSNGENIGSYTLEARIPNEWKMNGDCDPDYIWTLLVNGSAVGHKKIDKFHMILTDRLRIRISDSISEPVIKSFEAYKA